MDRYQKKNLEYILEYLKKIDILIAIELIKFRENNSSSNIFQGSFIADEEIDSLMSTNNESNNNQSIEIANLENNLINLELAINKNISIAIEEGIQLRFIKLAKIFNLSDFEIDCLLITIAPAIDKKYVKIYGYLNDDITQKLPTVDLILNLLCLNRFGESNKLKYIKSFENLLKHNLLEIIGDDSLNFLSKSLKIDDRIANYLLGFNNLDSKIANKVNLFNDNINLNHLFLSENTQKSIENLINYHEENNHNNIIILIQGNSGNGKKTIARGIANEWKIPILETDITSLIIEEDFENIISRMFRESLLQNSAIYLKHFEVLFDEEGKNSQHKKIIFKALKEYNSIVFLGSEKSISNLEKIGKKLFKIEIPKFSYLLRKKIWKKYLNNFNFSPIEIDELSNKFKFSPAQIENVTRSANNLIATKNMEEIDLDDIYKLCRLQYDESINSLAKKVEVKYQLDDLILPEDRKEQLIELKNYIKNKGKVFYDWDFVNKLSLGKGVNVIFSGSSGTGKTMAAETIANDLGLDLYKIDLSMIVSKYIGETEKNLNKIFNDAESSNAILFFDEADALFGKRTNVNSSHDRYANIEVSYLLQKMEEHDGIVIMATNLIQNIDDAFLRRIQFSIEFPFPDAKYRKEIWKVSFPEKAPQGNDIDFDFLANGFELPGGNIKNSVVAAAFYAAEEDKKEIQMEDIIKGLKREYQKIGKAYSKSDFGEYFE